MKIDKLIKKIKRIKKEASSGKKNVLTNFSISSSGLGVTRWA